MDVDYYYFYFYTKMSNPSLNIQYTPSFLKQNLKKKTYNRPSAMSLSPKSVIGSRFNHRSSSPSGR